MKRSISAAVIYLTFVFSLNAQILNGSFEADANDPNGLNPNGIRDPNGPWDYDGQEPQIFRTYTHTPYLSTIHAIDGQFFVLLNTYPNDGTEATDHGKLTQVIDVNDGESIIGAYFFATDDWVPWNDIATIKLISTDPCSLVPEITLVYIDVASVGDYRSTEQWIRFSHTFDSNEAGTYSLTLLVEDMVDHQFSSYLAVDDLYIEPRPLEPLCGYKLEGDINLDCKVDFIDFMMAMSNWLIDCSITPQDPECLIR